MWIWTISYFVGQDSFVEPGVSAQSGNPISLMENLCISLSARGKCFLKPTRVDVCVCVWALMVGSQVSTSLMTVSTPPPFSNHPSFWAIEMQAMGSSSWRKLERKNSRDCYYCSLFGKIIKLLLSLERLILVPALKACLQSPGTHVPTALKPKCLA